MSKNKLKYLVVFSRVNFSSMSNEQVRKEMIDTAIKTDNPFLTAEPIEQVMESHGDVSRELSKEFINDDPITARREGIKYLKSVVESINEMYDENFKDSDRSLLEFYGAGLYFSYGDLPAKIIMGGGNEPGKEMLLNLEEEYDLYRVEGYRIDGEPKKLFAPMLARELTLLPE